MATADDFSLFDDEVDLAVEFKKLKAAVLFSGSELGEFALIPVESFRRFFPWATCYLPEEMKYLLSLPKADALNLHRLKKMSGGHFEIKQGEGDDSRSIAQGS